MRDFFIRPDLQRLGVPERTIRVLEKVSLLIEALEQINANAGAITDVEDATDAIEELIEDAELTLAALDERLDDVEDGNGPYVKKTGDTMSGALNVNSTVTASGLVRAGSLRVDTAPAVGAAVPSTHTVDINFGGSTYKVLLSNV
jgi:hypothetical protein